ncbi:uncharacterized protein LOC127877153 [Dreissena polymorpha]|uniref:uncharacterized protein LOC127877153 n=1 Tax=Dreissena polymorpha TaxID=45954 RepID=UPI0022643E7F|nr:uncharacterized protein LOC127877153 [Dreissena polymorpha]
MAVQASYHQGDERFRGSGKQCCANSAVAIQCLYKLTSPSNWTSDTLNHILLEGDALYMSLSEKHDIEYFCSDDISKYVCKLSSPLHGSLNSRQTEGPMYVLEDALQILMDEHKCGCLITIGQSMPAYSMAIIKDANSYFVFDPHSRNEVGMLSSSGAATMTIHKDILAVKLFLQHLAASLKLAETPFEVAKLLNQCGVSDSDTDSEFSGFSAISEGEYTCKLYLAHDASHFLSDMSDVSDVSEMYCVEETDLDSISIIQDSDVENLNESDVFLNKINLEIFQEFSFSDDAKDDRVVETNDANMEKNNDNANAADDEDDEQDDSFDYDGSKDPDYVLDSDDNDNDDDDDDDNDDDDVPLINLKFKGKGRPNIKAVNVGRQGDSEVEIGSNKTNAIGVAYSLGNSEGEVSRLGNSGEGTGSQENSVVDRAKSSEVEVGILGNGEASIKANNEVEVSSVGNREEGSHNKSQDGVSSLENSEAASRGNCEVVVSNQGCGEVDGHGNNEIEVNTLGNDEVGHFSSTLTSTDRTDQIVGSNLQTISTDHTDHTLRSVNQTDFTDQTLPSDTQTTSTDCTDQTLRSDDQTIRKGTRKRQRNEVNWKRNITKRRKNSGQSYVSSSGKIKRAKKVKNGCGQNCRKKCHSKISPEQREAIFDEFWKLGSYPKQKEFLCSTVKESKVKRVRVRDTIIKDRKMSRNYLFQVNGLNVDVCQQFYKDTLDVSTTTISTALHRAAPHIHTSFPDRRGTHANRPNKIPDVIIQDIKDHIERFPRVESHYCRQSTSKEYLEGGLNLSKMYSLYSEQCHENNVCPAKESMYRYIFNNSFNIAFNSPAKDRCDFCSQYDNMNPDEQKAIHEKYEKHIQNKVAARAEKEKAKEASQTDQYVCAACFDLQQVMLLPKGNQSCLYYSRKLCNYNLSFYSLGTGEAYCYVWHEGIAGRGSCEIASCVYNFLQTMASKSIKSVETFSDNCGGQNRNRFFLTMLWYSMKTLKFDCMSHKYLERGHTQNENDSVHSSIEKSCKNIKIYTTSQWCTCMQMARRMKPYSVTEMGSDNFFDFKHLSTKVRNLDKDTQGFKIKWMKIKTISFHSENPDTAQIQYDFNKPCVYLNMQPNLRNKGKQLPCLKQLFRPGCNKQTIPHVKYYSLVKLCENNTIPSAYHAFYKDLPCE